MPEKSPIISLIGQATSFSFSNEESAKPKWLFDLDPISSESETGEPEVNSYLGSSPNQVSQADEPVPITTPTPLVEKPVQQALRVRIKPEVPELTKQPGAALQIHQLWQGTVSEVKDESFIAVLSDKTQQGTPDEEAEFAHFELREDDRPLLKPGSVFYWMIGTELTPSGQVRNISTIQFSRLPLWTRSSLRAASEKASRAQQWLLKNADQTAQS